MSYLIPYVMVALFVFSYVEHRGEIMKQDDRYGVAIFAALTWPVLAPLIAGIAVAEMTKGEHQ